MDFSSPDSPFSIEVTAPGYQAVKVSGLITNTCGCTNNCPSPQEASVALIAVLPPIDSGTPDGG
jgi:hypothetical protein